MPLTTTSSRFARIWTTLIAGILAASLGSALSAQTHPNHAQGFDSEKLYQFGGMESVNLFNGNLNLTIPIGGTYPVSGTLSYGLTLTYSGNVWEWEEVPDANPNFTTKYMKALPRMRSNAGLGWLVSLGRMNPAQSLLFAGQVNYESPDGNLHQILNNLHDDGSTTPDFGYSQDGSYLRLKRSTCELESPDGTVRKFELEVPSNTCKRLTQIRDRSGNALNITYPNSPTYPGIQDWKLVDTHLRTHWVRFRPDPSGYYSEGVVEKIELAAFNGQPAATYTFETVSKEITRGRSDVTGATSPPITGTVWVPLLTKLTLLDNSAFSMPVADYDSDTTQPTDSKSGHLKGMTLPTGGRYEWDWMEYDFPLRSASITPSKFTYQAKGLNDPFRRSVGLSARRHETASGASAGTWLYAPTFDLSTPGKEHKVQVTDPLSNRSTYYFSVYTDDYNSQTPEPAGWISEEYGLPFTRNQSDGTSPGRYLSAEINAGASTLKRKVYVRYERDGLTDANPRLASERTVYVDDGSKVADVTYSDFDGVGHYRKTETAGTFAVGNVVTTFVNFNPGLCATCTPGTTSAWLLETYTTSTVTEGSSRSKTESCFNAAGRLERLRTYKNSGTATTDPAASADDVVVRNTYTAGNRTSEEYFGGDSGGLGTGALCSLALSAPDYRIDHTYQYGTLRTSQYSGAFGKSLDRDIDLNTGLVKTSRDSALLATSYEYDAMGHLTYVKPAQGGWTQYAHYPYDPPSGNLAQVWIYQRPNGGGATLSEEQVRFDHLGRVSLERRKMADGSFSDRTTTYDLAGNLFTKTEWGSTAKTTYSLYDPFGRPGKVTPPDGAAHEVTMVYAGVRSVARTVKVGTAWNGSAVTEAAATTTELYDRQGRLYQVTEPANPNGSNATTTYGYDVGGRLKTVTQVAHDATGVNKTQTRQFTYDNRGFLTAEQHPEKGGASGNGSVSYLSYDALGNPGRVVDGPNDLTYTYDAAGRVTRIRETGTGFTSCSTSWTSGPRCLKEFTYGIATGNGVGDYHLGKLQVSKRYNYPVVGGSTYTAIVNQTYTYGGKQGAVSARETSLTFGGATTERFNATWTWNDLDEVASIGYPQCNFSQYCTATQPRTVTATYTNGFLTAVPGYATSITYHPNGQINAVTHANNVVDTYFKDPYNLARPNKIESKYSITTLWSSGTYAYDGTGNVTKTGSHYFLYDLASRITSGTIYTGSGGGATGPKPFSHTYDGFGNLQAMSTATTRNTPTSSTTNRLTGGVSYDTAGNLTLWNLNNYQYDRLNQMTRMAAGAEIWLYMYDADDERVWAFKEGANPRFDRWTLRDLDGKVLRTYEATNYVWSWSEDHVYRASSLLASVKTGATTHLHTDHLGTVRALSNSNGASLSYHAYYPFGEEATNINQDTQRMKFTGHERDLGVATSAADDLDYMHARFCNPQTGRFLGTDRFDVLSLQFGDEEDVRRFREYLGTPQSWNRYAYARGNPLLYVDPDGDEALAFSATGAWAIGQGGAGAGTAGGAAATGAAPLTLAVAAGVGLGYAVNQIPGVSEALTFQPISNAIANVFFASQADSARNLINAKVTTVLVHISSYSSPGGPNEPDDRNRKKNIYERMKRHLDQARDKLKRLPGDKQKEEYAKRIRDAAEKLEKWWQAQ